MKFVSKNCLLLSLSIILSTTQLVQAQVRGISYTLSPTGSYQYWNEVAGIGNGYLIGGQLGFGFGQAVELKANYQQGYNLVRDFSAMNLPNYTPGILSDADVSLTRWGGDLKLNLATGAVMPYFTIGTGVQTLKLNRDDEVDNQQIYVNGGIGLQLSLADRYALNVSALNNYFYLNPYKTLLNDAERTALGVNAEDFPNKQLSNWSLNASLLFYLGGRRAEKMTALDRAYQEKYSSGFNGLSLPIEVSAGNLDFSENLPYVSAKFTQVSSGFDFGQYVGLRAFYLRDMTEGYFSELGKLAIYGGEGRFRLSDGTGIYPSISLGGGVIDPLNGYIIAGEVNGENDVNFKNTPFASGGLELTIPFSRHVKVSGFAKALLTTSASDIANTDSPDELSTSWMYGVNMSVILGKTKNVEKMQQSAYSKAVMDALAEERAKTEQLKASYDARINLLQQEINDAEANGDTETAVEKYKEKDQVTQDKAKIEAIQKQEEVQNKQAMESQDPQDLYITPAALQAMVAAVKASNEQTQLSVQDALNSNARNSSSQIANTNKQLAAIQRKIDSLSRVQERSMQPYNAPVSSQTTPQVQSAAVTGGDAGTIEQLNRNIAFQNEQIKQLSDKVNSLTDSQSKLQKAHQDLSKQQKRSDDESKKQGGVVPLVVADSLSQANDSSKANNEFIKRFVASGNSVYAGVNLGGNFGFNLGYRREYQYKDSKLYFVPEAFMGFGDPFSFGVSGNGIVKIPLKKNTRIAPYVGGGLGLLVAGDKNSNSGLKFASNIILGVDLLRFANGKFYVDYTTRSFFNRNQFALGYRF